MLKSGGIKTERVDAAVNLAIKLPVRFDRIVGFDAYHIHPVLK